MMSSRYPHTSDPATRKAQRVAALAKSVAATAVVCVIAGLATLTARDVRPADHPSGGENVVLHAVADLVESTAPTAPPATAAPSTGDEPYKSLPFDPDAVEASPATVPY